MSTSNLTVDENLAQQGLLYGLSGKALYRRRDEVLQRLAWPIVVRIWSRHFLGACADGLISQSHCSNGPQVLLLDEPSTGLDPGARSDLWCYLRSLQEDQGTTIVLTTHLLEEADRADKIAILNVGRVVANGEPAAIRASLGETRSRSKPTHRRTFANRSMLNGAATRWLWSRCQNRQR